jgi:hypothetical protein
MALKIDTSRLKAGRDSIVVDTHARTTGVPTAYRTTIHQSHTHRERWSKIPTQYFFRQPVKRLSALCALQVTHALSTLNQSSLFRTKDFTQYMNDQYPLIAWDPTSVGRFLSELAEGAHHMIDSQNDQLSYQPFIRNRDGSGFYYVFHENAFTTKWLHAIIETLKPLADRETRGGGFIAGKQEFGGEPVTALWLAMSAIEEALKGDLANIDEIVKFSYD